MTVKTWQLKTCGIPRNSSKREVYSNAIIPQETRKTWNRQPNFTHKSTGQRRAKKPPRFIEGKKS